MALLIYSFYTGASRSSLTGTLYKKKIKSFFFTNQLLYRYKQNEDLFGMIKLNESDHFEKHGDGCESELTSRRFCMWRILVLLSLSHKVFWVRCGTNCIDSFFVTFYTPTSTDSQEIPYTVLSSQIKQWLVAH